MNNVFKVLARGCVYCFISHDSSVFGLEVKTVLEGYWYCLVALQRIWIHGQPIVYEIIYTHTTREFISWILPRWSWQI